MIKDLKDSWKDQEDYHRLINESFAQKVNETPELKSLRDWVEKNIWGFGERSFYWMWNELVTEIPEKFNFLEIGVFRGQILALIKILSTLHNKQSKIIGVSPMSNKGGYWESNYFKDVNRIFRENNIKDDYFIYPTDSNNIQTLYSLKDIQLDLLYIDGAHDYQSVREDIINYTPLLKVGGYLVIDDSANNLHLPNGYFRGHADVSRAVDELLPPFATNDSFEFQFNVVHNRVWKKIK